MALMSVIMLGILIAVVFNEGEEELSPNNTRLAPIGQNAPRQASSETLARIEAMQRQIGQESPMSLPPIPAEALQPNQAQDNAASSSANAGSNIATAPIRLAPVESTSSIPAEDNSPVVTTPILQTKEQTKNAPETERVPIESRSTTDPFDKTQSWLERNPNRYTLQLLGTHNQDTVQDFIRDQGSLDAFSYFHALHNGRDWYVVVYGEYRNRSEAIAAVESLPQGLRQLNPWARSVRGIQQDIRKAGEQ